MIAEQNYGAHSAQVEMGLIVNGERVSLTQMGPDFLFVEAGREHPPGYGTIILRVDRNERRWEVWLPDGIRSNQQRVAISKPAGK